VSECVSRTTHGNQNESNTLNIIAPVSGVSCYTGESSSNVSINGSIVQTTFVAPPIPDLKFFLLGKGERGPGCGDIHAVSICDNPDCGKVHYAKAHCDRKACPVCYTRWIHEETNNVSARLLSEEALKRHKSNRLVPIVVSPRQDNKPVTKEELNMLIHDGYEYLKNKGVLGGSMIFHAFRVTKHAKEEAIKEGIRYWAWIRKQEHPEDFYYYSPHMHITAFVGWLEAPLEKNTNHQVNEYLESVGVIDNYERYILLDNEGTARERKLEREWIYKTKVNEKGKVIDLKRKAKREKEVKGLTAYLLSHAVTIEGVEDSFHSVRYFGTCSYNKFKKTKEEKESNEKPEEESKCKICGFPLVGLWTWQQRWYWAVVYHDIDEPKYWNEICSALDGEPPPDNAKDFLIGGRDNGKKE